MTNYEANHYSSREELEAAIVQATDRTTDPKADYSIIGTREELARLGLSDGTRIWGVPVTSSDPLPLSEVVDIPDRGETHPSELN